MKRKRQSRKVPKRNASKKTVRSRLEAKYRKLMAGYAPWPVPAEAPAEEYIVIRTFTTYSAYEEPITD